MRPEPFAAQKRSAMRSFFSLTRLRAWGEALRRSTHSFHPDEFEAMYRENAPQQMDAVRRNGAERCGRVVGPTDPQATVSPMMVGSGRCRLMSARIAAQFGMARNLLGREDRGGCEVSFQVRCSQGGAGRSDALQRGGEALPGDGPAGEQAVWGMR